MPEGMPPNVFGDSPLNRDWPYDFAHDFLSPVWLPALHSGVSKDPVLRTAVSYMLAPYPKCFRHGWILYRVMSRWPATAQKEMLAAFAESRTVATRFMGINDWMKSAVSGCCCTCLPVPCVTLGRIVLTVMPRTKLLSQDLDKKSRCHFAAAIKTMPRHRESCCT